MFLRRGGVLFETKRVDGLFLIINSGSGLIGHANGLHIFVFCFVFGDYFVAIYLWDVCF